MHRLTKYHDTTTRGEGGPSLLPALAPSHRVGGVGMSSVNSASLEHTKEYYKAPRGEGGKTKVACLAHRSLVKIFSMNYML